MIIHVFDPFTESGESFDDVYSHTITTAISYDAKFYASAIGEFTLTLPLTEQRVYPNQVLNLRHGVLSHWLLVRSVSTSSTDSAEEMVVSGTDLKGLLSQRITLYSSKAQDSGTFGYDVVQGSTSECCEHYLNNNLINPVDSERRMPNLIFESTTEGKTSDTYMSRFELVSDVVQKLCDDADICWDVVGDYERNCYKVVLWKGTDRSSEQTNRQQVIFSRNRRNTSQLSYELSNSEEKNAFYATKSGGTLVSDAMTTLILRNSKVPKGYERREMQLNVSCDSVADVEKYALHDVGDYVENEALKFELADPGGFGVDYYLGDRVSALDEFLNKKLSERITAVSLQIGTDTYDISVTLGSTVPGIMNKIQRKIKNGVS